MREYIIDERTKGRKLFNFVRNILPGLKNSEIFKLLRNKTVVVNEKKTESNYLLNLGDRVKIYLKEEHFDKKGKKNKFRSINFKLDIVYEDNNILVVNKPAGILTHPDKKDYKNNMFEYVRSYLYKKGKYDPADTFTPAPCHRLDKNTSGLLIFAKTHESLKSITKEFRQRSTIKIYLAMVCGKIDTEFLIASRIYDNVKQENMMTTDQIIITDKIPDKEEFFKNNNLSATLVKPVKYKENASLVTVELWTGKKHQIRVQLSASGHPLIGEKKYFNIESIKVQKSLNFDKYYLHSYKIKLNNYNEMTAEIPKDFQGQIKKIFN